MKSIEFVYWLQGCFELSGTKNLTVQQIETVKRHFEMVKITDGKTMLPFCHFFEGFMQAVDWQLDKDNTVKLIEKLNSCFEHVAHSAIKPSSLAPQSELIKC